MFRPILELETIRRTPAWLDARLFPSGPCLGLNLFRFFYAGALLFTVVAKFPAEMRLVETGACNPVPSFEKFGFPLLTVPDLTAIHWVLVAALAFAAVGLCARTALIVSWIAFFLYTGTILGFIKAADTAHVTHARDIVFPVLLVLSAAPGIAVYGADGLRRRGWRFRPDPAERAGPLWPVQLVKATIAVGYFGAGYCKVATNLLWADGHTLQAFLLGGHFTMDSSLALWVAERWWLCLASQIGTLAWELTFFLILFFPRLTWIYVGAGLAFHAGIKATMGIDFFHYFSYVYFIFLVDLSVWPWRRAGAGDAGRTEGGRPGAPRSGLPARIFFCAVTAILLGCVLFRIEFWPLTDYRVYQTRTTFEDWRIYRTGAWDRSGKFFWLDRADLTLKPEDISSRIKGVERLRKKKRRPGQSDAPARWELLRQMQAIVRGLPPATHERAERIVVMQRHIRRDAGGRFVTIDEPYAEIPVRPARPRKDPAGPGR